MGSTLGVGPTLARVVLAACVGVGPKSARLIPVACGGAVTAGRVWEAEAGFNLRVRTRFACEAVVAAGCRKLPSVTRLRDGSDGRALPSLVFAAPPPLPDPPTSLPPLPD